MANSTIHIHTHIRIYTQLFVFMFMFISVLVHQLSTYVDPLLVVLCIAIMRMYYLERIDIVCVLETRNLYLPLYLDATGTVNAKTPEFL